MDRRGFLVGLCAAVGACGLLAGCGEAGSNIPEERVISKEDSDAMMKGLEEGRKGMNQASGKK
ncbi:twin-arginine translocation signal domain-containing protein [Planctomyces sp. SH-PL62]|uniref:twin-arginine translocation signal domain-containing protein n=1 Tax=Planctomyces sp. SH-PL62 TaxID=1636152 RepID=UPI00078D6C39|nr:twin-arginine translocation signal domain-containing protein [Planctomyces sp. SH-PL62]AMV36297.1 hypothetical protein VT85_02555 [Planctomyces sp. SH-PL62]